MKLNADISHDFFADNNLQVTSVGQDVTLAFKDDIPPPVKAEVLVVEGPGGGNPCIELTFIDEDHAWEWFSNCYMPDDPYAPVEFAHHFAEDTLRNTFS